MFCKFFLKKTIKILLILVRKKCRKKIKINVFQNMLIFFNLQNLNTVETYKYDHMLIEEFRTIFTNSNYRLIKK